MANKFQLDPTNSGREIYLSYDELKKLLEQSIAATLKKGGVELDEDFFEVVDYHVVRKARDTTEERSLVSEKNTRFENHNANGEISEYRFSSSYEESSSFTLTTSKGYSIGIGGDLGVGFMGGSAGVNTGYQYSRQRGRSEEKGRTNTKELCLSGSLQPHTVVTVKELMYEVRENAQCNLVLMVGDRTNIPFNYEKNGEKGSVEMKKLFERGKISSYSRAFEHVGKTVTMNLAGPCTYRSTERALEVSTAPSDEERTVRIQQHAVVPCSTAPLPPITIQEPQQKPPPLPTRMILRQPQQKLIPPPLPTRTIEKSQ